MDSNAFVVLARITNAHGIKGEVKLRSFTSPASNIRNFPILHDANGKAYELSIRAEAKQQFICKIKGITSRNESELLKNIDLGISRSDLPALNDDEVYLSDLVGVQVVDTTNQHFGEVIATHNYGAGDILEIKKADNKSELYSYTEATFPKFDQDKRSLTISPPEILS